MTKIKFVPYVVFLIVFAGIRSQAQLITNRAALQKASAEISLQEKTELRKLLTLSRQKGWPLSIRNKTGQRAILTGVDPHGYPLYVGTNDLGSAASIRTDQLWPGGSTGLNLSGSSANMKGKLAIWDEDSLKSTHQELINRVLQKDHPTGVSDHSTHVAGIMMASGVNPAAKGMAFGLQQILAYDFNNHLSEMSAESPNILVSNHSYGTISGWNYNNDQSRWEFWGNSGDTADYKFGYYSVEAQVWDSIAYNAPFYLIVKSAGNNRDINGPAVGQPYWRFNTGGTMVSSGNRPAGISSNNGYDIMPTYGTAKNILTVGAANSVPGGYTQSSDVTLSTFSSWGPTDDGRIKPDVVTDGVDVLSAIATSNNAYAIFSGTSMSSPAAAGSAILLQEYYSKIHAGAFMRSATLKGLIIHTADETGPAPGPDYQFGWGLMNTQKAAAVITSNNTDQLISENNLLNGNSFTLPVVASGKGSLVATLSWTDPAATVNTGTLLNNPARKLVNDLDLRIVGPDSTRQPWVLNPAIPSAAAFNGDNVLDNVEKIVIDNVVPGQSYSI
ncbi:MAG TPA: S8 family serine peptidase, partial [Puia sp.]|nr:S8 family serine peptidase [Puia sp.]